MLYKDVIWQNFEFGFSHENIIQEET